MVAPKTEGKHAGEFLISEMPGGGDGGGLSRDVKTVAKGQNLVAGEIVMLSAGKLVAHDGVLDTPGAVETPVEGILYDNVDASATGEDADVPNSVYIERLAEVADGDLTFPTESTAGGEKVAVIASLLIRNIKTR